MKLKVTEGHNDRTGAVRVSFVQVIRFDLREGYVKLCNTSLFNYSVGMSKYNLEWWSKRYVKGNDDSLF